jgi:hypothetical protein
VNINNPTAINNTTNINDHLWKENGKSSVSGNFVIDSPREIRCLAYEYFEYYNFSEFDINLKSEPMFFMEK